MTLIPIRTGGVYGNYTVPTLPAHANCVFRGAKSPKGTIVRIKDGDGSPFPVVTDKGQFRVDEIEEYL